MCGVKVASGCRASIWRAPGPAFILILFIRTPHPPGLMSRSIARRLAIPAIAILLAGAGACTHAANNAPSTSTDIILADEIARSRAVSAYDAVAKLRHNFLSDRGPTSIVDKSAPRLPNVYLDGMPYGEIASLNNIPAQQIASIRLYRAGEAQYKFGSDNPAGVIEVTTKKE